MKSWLLQLRRNSRIASATSLSLVAGTLVTLAIAWPGQKAVEAHLNDGSVWINFTKQGQVGRLNPKVKAIDTVVDGANDDVLQDGSDVVRVSRSTISYVRVADGTAGDEVRLADGVLAYGGRVVATVGGKRHRVWRIPEGTAGSFSTKTTPYVRGLNGGTFGKVAVGPRGTMAALNPTTGTVTYVDDSGTAGDSFRVSGVGRTAQLTLVGTKAVVFDPASGRLFRDGESVVTIAGSGASAKVQQASDGGQDVYVATSRRLWRVPMEGGKPATVDTGHNGEPAAPAVLGGAVHAAWVDPSSPRAYVRHALRDADHSSATRSGPLRSLKPTANLAFRTNRNVIVLNDTFNGYAWLVQNRRIDVVKTWDPEKSKKKRNVESDPVQAKRRDANDPPQPKDDDDLGARPGQATILPVLLNDGDPDGDVLSIVDPQLDAADTAALESVNNDSQLQFKASTAGTYSFSYAVEDGHGNRESARGHVKVAGSGGNKAPAVYPDQPPEKLLPAVVPGSTTSVFLLAPMYDPDGDPFSLDCGAARPRFNVGRVIACRPDGVVTLKVDHGGQTPEVSFAMTDASDSGKGSRTFQWASRTKAEPETNADRVVVKAGETATVRPLANDRDPLGDGGLKLDDISGDQQGIEVGQPSEGGTLAIRAPERAEAGTRYLRYRTHDAGAAEDLIRVDIVEPKKDSTNDVVAVKDDARLRPGRTTLVDVLANDYDRNGDTLVVSALKTAPGIKASVIGRRVVRIESDARIASSKVLTYTVSNGQQTQRGQIVVTGDSAGHNLPPRAVDDDQITVKAGAIRSIDVLSNDVDPDGDELVVSQAGPEGDEGWPAGGVAFASGRKMRVRAPDQPGQYLATYTVRDPDGATGTGTVKIDVPDTAFAAETNQAPVPPTVTARAVAGGTIRIALNLEGTDPDGDEVSLKSISSSPRLGVVSATGQDWILYKANAAGQDHLRATVVDPLGLQGNVDVNIGIARANVENQAPAALDDQISVQPGHRMSYDVLANDSDLDGDRLILDHHVLAVKDANAEAGGRMVSLDVPKQPGKSPESRVVGYRIADGKGGVSDAHLTVLADENAPDYPPVAQDDAVTPAQVARKGTGGAVTVDVLKNDSDPDGTLEDLKVRSSDRGVTVSGHKLLVKLSAADRTVLYRISDRHSDGYGFVYVPGTASLPPSLKPNKEVHYRVGDDLKRIDLADYVAVRPGHRPQLASVRVTRAKGNGEVAVRDGQHAAVFYSAKAADFRSGDWTDSVTVRIKDDANLATAKTAEVSIPVVVEPRSNANPTMLDTRVIVGRYDPKPVIVDLDELARDPNAGDRLRYKVKAAAKAPIKVDLNGHELSVSARNNARSGEYVAKVFVSDGHGGKVSADVTVVVQKSAEPLIALPGVITRHGRAGQPTTVDISDYASVPEGRSFVVRSADGNVKGARVRASGTKVIVTPKSGGTVVVTYEVAAKGLLPATGKVVVDAANPPGAPGQPTAQALTSDSIRLSWAPAASDGGPVTGYEIDGHGIPCGAATVCVIRGLKAGVAYQFKVRATNDSSDDPGPWSPPSAPVTPTKQPDQMSGLTVANDPKGMDKKLTLRWTKPNDYGSAITKYEIMVNGKQATSVSGSTTTTTIPNLVNGTPYRFRIRAVNSANGTPANFSAETAPIIPFGAPLAAPSPVVASSKSGAQGGGEIEVSWTFGNEQFNGRTPTQFIVTRHVDGGGSGKSFTLSGSTHDMVDSPIANGPGYSYSVQAVNPAGTGPAGAVSEVLYPWGPAKAPKITAGKDGDHQVTIGIEPGDLNGGELQSYTWSAGGKSGSIGPGDTTISGLDNKKQDLSIVPITNGKGSLSTGELAGDQSNTISVSPYGVPPTPNVSASNGSDSVSVNWSAAENGRPIDRVEYRISGAASDSGNKSGGSGSWSRSIGREKTVSVEVWSVDSEGQSSQHWSGQVSSQPYARNVIVSKGGSQRLSECGPTATSCKAVVVRLEDFPPGDYTYNLGGDWCAGFEGTCASSRPIGANGSDDYYSASDGYGNVTAHVNPGDHTGSRNF